MLQLSTNAHMHLQLSMHALLVEHVHTFTRACAHFQIQLQVHACVHCSLQVPLKGRPVLYGKVVTCEKF